VWRQIWSNNPLSEQGGPAPHPGGVAERDLGDVQEHLVGALAVPHLVPGVVGG
jgi:hypothetical protein